MVDMFPQKCSTRQTHAHFTHTRTICLLVFVCGVGFFCSVNVAFVSSQNAVLCGLNVIFWKKDLVLFRNHLFLCSKHW